MIDIISVGFDSAARLSEVRLPRAYIAPLTRVFSHQDVTVDLITPSSSLQRFVCVTGMTLGQSEAAAPAALGVFFLFASYLNLNDPDWLLWSTAYALGAAICVWTALRGWTVGTDGMGKVVSTAPRLVCG